MISKYNNLLKRTLNRVSNVYASDIRNIIAIIFSFTDTASDIVVN